MSFCKYQRAHFPSFSTKMNETEVCDSKCIFLTIAPLQLSGDMSL